MLLLPGCASGQPDALRASSSAPPPSTTPSATQLTVELQPRPAAPVTTYRLRCQPPGGDHPDPAAACRDLAAAADPFAPPPTDAICTEQYGGPQTARVQGTYRGRPVDVRLDRTDGCAIARWEAFGAVLPALR